MKIKRLLTLLIAVAAVTFAGCGSNNSGISKTGFFLDTVCSVTVYGIDETNQYFDYGDKKEQEKQILQLITDAFKLCTEYENTLSKTIDSSDIARINNSGGDSVEVSNDTIEVLKKGIEYGDLSGGTFDITIGRVTDLWDFRSEEDRDNADAGKIPDKSKLEAAVAHVNYKDIVVNGNTVTLKDPDMEIDLGGIAKGYIADKLTAYLEENGVTSAIVDLGGNIVAIGGKAAKLTGDKQSDFSVGIKDPDSKTGELLGILKCSNKTVVTSGTYERYFEAEGKRYHHILDTDTGYPVDTDIVSATIIADKGHSVDGDGLSTSCLALGKEKAIKLIQSIDGVEAVIVDSSGDIYMSDDNIPFERS